MNQRTTVFTELPKLKPETALRRVEEQFKDAALLRHFTRVSDMSQSDFRLLLVVKGKWLLAWADGAEEMGGLVFDDALGKTSFRFAADGGRLRFASDDPVMTGKMSDPAALLAWWGKQRGPFVVEALRTEAEESTGLQIGRICQILELPAEDALLTYEAAVARYGKEGRHVGWKRKARLPAGTRLAVLPPKVRLVLGKGRAALPGHRELKVQLFSEGGTATGLGCRIRKPGPITPVRLTVAENQVDALNALFEAEGDGDFVARLPGIFLPRGSARSWPEDYEGVLLVKDDGLASYSISAEVWPLEAPDAATSVELKIE